MPRTSKRRLFFAVPIGDRLQVQIGELLKALKREAPRKQKPLLRWAKPEQLHITIQFIGDVPEEDVPKISQRGIPAVQGVPQMELPFTEFGGFRSLNRASVLYLGLKPGELSKIRETLDFEEDARPFVPHLTLARVKKPSNLHWTKNVLSELPPLSVCEIALYESILHSSGAEYKILEKYNLA